MNRKNRGFKYTEEEDHCVFLTGFVNVTSLLMAHTWDLVLHYFKQFVIVCYSRTATCHNSLSQIQFGL